MRLISDLVKKFWQQMFSFQKLAIRRAAVSLVSDANVEMRVDIHAYPPFGPKNLSHSSAIGVRNVVPAAKHNDPFAIAQKLCDNIKMSFVCFFQCAAQTHISEVEDLLLYIECCEFIKLLADRIWSRRRTDAAIISLHPFVLR